MYSLGLLMWRCIADRYGEEAMFTFFTEVVREGEPPVTAAQAFGNPWSDVKQTCVAAARAAADA